MYGGPALRGSLSLLLAPPWCPPVPTRHAGCVVPSPHLRDSSTQPHACLPLLLPAHPIACPPARLQRINDVIVANVGQFPAQMDSVIELVDEVTGQRRELDSPPVFQPAAPLVNATC